MAVQLQFVVLFALFLSLARATENTGKPVINQDIYTFFKENPGLWVYNTTEGNKTGGIICRHDVKVNITQETIFFNRSKNKSESELLKGNFMNWHEVETAPNNSMYVYDTADQIVGAEILDFSSKNNLCGVFTVMVYKEGNSKVHREVRVSDKLREIKPDNECSENFEELLRELETVPTIGKQGTSHYSTSCQ
uniref:Putative lipocalin-3 1 n=1 Tax=Amblyomma triste TaxID=251400 RepID=A0A023GD34_AMBTT